MKKYKFLLVLAFTLFVMLPFKVSAMQVIVKCADKDITLEVESSDTIEAIKEKIEDNTGISYKKQVLMHSGTKLINGRTLGDYYGIQNESTIELLLKLEFDRVEIYIDDPQEGNKPDTKAKLIMSNEDTKFEIDDIELKWYKVGQDDNVLLDDDALFEKDNVYSFNITDNGMEKVEEELEKNNYTVSNSMEFYYNGEFSYDNSSFYVGGVESVNAVTDRFVAGSPLPQTLKFILKRGSEEKEFTVNIDEWIELTDDERISLDESTIIENGKKYIPSVDADVYPELLQYVLTADFRTKMYLNGKETDYFSAEEEYKVIFDANGGKFKNNDKYVIDSWNNSYYDSLNVPTRDGYTFKGYYTEKIGGTKFEMILNESGIDSDMTFYAQWKLEEEVPKTLDNTRSSIIMGTISLIILVVATIYLKKEIK